MKQKEVDAIVLEIFNICMSKGLSFQKHQTGYIEVQDFDFKTNTFNFIERACFDTSNSLFDYTSYTAMSIIDLLEDVKQYKK